MIERSKDHLMEEPHGTGQQETSYYPTGGGMEPSTQGRHIERQACEPGATGNDKGHDEPPEVSALKKKTRTWGSHRLEATEEPRRAPHLTSDTTDQKARMDKPESGTTPDTN